MFDPTIDHISISEEDVFELIATGKWNRYEFGMWIDTHHARVKIEQMYSTRRLIQARGVKALDDLLSTIETTWSE